MLQHGVQERPRITIATGGGAGAVMGSGSVEALAGYDVTLLVPATDDGGSTKKVRAAFGGPGPGDTCNVLAAVSGNPGGELFRKRFGPEHSVDRVRALNEQLGAIAVESGANEQRVSAVLNRTADLAAELPDGLRGHSYGNLVLSGARLDPENQGSLTQASLETAKWLDARATVLPITDADATLYMWDGKQHIIGEDAIDTHKIHNLSETRVWLGGRPSITSQAEEAIVGSACMLIGPGSHFTSLLAIAGCEGFAQAVKSQGEAGGLIGTVANLVVEPQVMKSLTVAEHIQLLQSPLGGRLFDFLIYNTGEIPGRIPVRCNEGDIRMVDAKTIGAHLVDTAARVTHDPNDRVACAGLRSDVRHNPAELFGVLKDKVLGNTPPRQLQTC